MTLAIAGAFLLIVGMAILGVLMLADVDRLIAAMNHEEHLDQLWDEPAA